MIYQRFFKRILDLIILIIGTPIFVPVFLIIYILIKLDGGLPIFSHTRVGFRGNQINVYKFRTMINDAEEKLSDLLNEDDKLKKEWDTFHKLQNDPRVTRLGNFLRKSKLDELPQIYNILDGSMSFVGPRPLTEEEFDSKFKKSQKEIYLSVLPGITGHWQSKQNVIIDYSDRINLELEYINKMSLLFDIKIIIETFLNLARKR